MCLKAQVYCKKQNKTKLVTIGSVYLLLWYLDVSQSAPWVMIHYTVYKSYGSGKDPDDTISSDVWLCPRVVKHHHCQLLTLDRTDIFDIIFYEKDFLS